MFFFLYIFIVCTIGKTRINRKQGRTFPKKNIKYHQIRVLSIFLFFYLEIIGKNFHLNRSLLKNNNKKHLAKKILN